MCCLLLPPGADVALEREVEGDLLVGDMGQGLPFRPGAFDGCIRFKGQHTKKKYFLIFMFVSDFVFSPISP